MKDEKDLKLQGQFEKFNKTIQNNSQMKSKVLSSNYFDEAEFIFANEKDLKNIKDEQLKMPITKKKF